MKRYTHLTESERYHIWTMKKQNNSLRSIAKDMDRSVSTISREIKRNSGQRGYRHNQAQEFASYRHKEKKKHIKVTDEITRYIREKLKLLWSPEQIGGRLRIDKSITLSHETIYRFILKDKTSGGSIYKYLRHQCKKYRKRYGGRDYRGRIPNRVDIDNRPTVVNDRSRIGDWEADTIIGKGHQGSLVTVAERKSRMYLAIPIVRKTAYATVVAITELLKPMENLVHTITFDNGREFSRHMDIASQLGCDTYFAKPYHSWERGLNENHNGLLRQFFPKKMSLHKLTKKNVALATSLMNNRPRKCLGFNTPSEIFSQYLLSKDTC